MKRRHRRAKRYRRRSSLKSRAWGPLVILGGIILGILAAAALIIFVALPKVLPLFGVDYSAPFAPTPTPVPTPRPTPTPRPIEMIDPSELQNEVLMPAGHNYVYFGNPYAYGDELIFTTGKVVETSSRMVGMYFYDPETQESTEAGEPLRNDHYMYPAFNDKWLVYLDAKAEGGGQILAIRRDQEKASAVVVKDVYTGYPELKLDGDYLAWMERTGTRMDKLFVCDLNTMESTTMQMFSASTYGQSLPSLMNGVLVWADADYEFVDEKGTSAIHSISINASSINTYLPKTYVHDPEGNGTYYAWLDGNHGPDTRLYYGTYGGKPIEIDSGVVEFGLANSFIAYGKDEQIYVYLLDKKKKFLLTEEWEAGQFLGVSGNKVFWMDVTTRERDILKFATIE